MTLARQGEGRGAHVATLTITNGTSASAVVPRADYQGFTTLLLVAPATLDNNLNVEILDWWESDDTLDASYRDYQEIPGTDVELAADKAIMITPPPSYGWRLKDQTGNVTGDRTIYVYGLR